MELYANNPTTTLNGAINNAVTSIVVHDASTFPATGNFRILIDSEIMKVTAVSSNTFTVVRAQEGTSAVSHADNASVDGVITKATLDNFRSDSVLSDTYANLPSAGFAGRQYWPSDGGHLLRDNGSSWEYWTFIGGIWQKVTRMDTSGFSWINQNSSTVTANGSMTTLANTGHTGFSLYVKSIPSSGATPWGISVALDQSNNPGGGLVGGGICIRQSSNGKFIWYGYQEDASNTTMKIEAEKWTDVNTFSASIFTLNAQALLPSPRWLKVHDDGTNMHFYVSSDNLSYYEIINIGHTAFVTADQYGVFVRSGSGDPSSFTVIALNEGV